jgi:formylglycine-generating enzyme required for sulfatase activity/tRNA A-37 threonylcarbamoyl transferase component Bud32
MSFHTRCPNCGESHQYAETRIDQTANCDKCGTTITLIPESRVMAPGEEPALPSFSTARRDEDLPTAFGRYKVLSKIGQGAMGIVYLAHDEKLNRQVALKIPLKDYKRFHREASVAAQFHHPNFCPIHDVGEDRCVPYLVMAFIEGKSLDKWIVRGQPWETRKAVELVQTLALALSAAHKETVIHRDLKPANIMIDRKGQLFLMDFGLARQVDSGGPLSTADGTVLGTAAYMPPEQAKGRVKEIDERSDVYSLGAIFYELLTGRLPFEAEFSYQVLAMVVGTEPTPPLQLNPAIDARLEAIVLKAMAKKPEDRYASMDEFAGALQAWLDNLECGSLLPLSSDSQSGSKLPHSRDDENRIPPTPPPLETGKKPRTRVAFLLVFLAVGGSFIYFTEYHDWGRPASLPETPAPKVPATVAPRAPDPPSVIAKADPPADKTKPIPPKAAVETPPPAATVDDSLITNTLGMKLKLIPAGEFAMGSDATDPDASDDEKVDGKKHQVRIAKPFYLGTTEVTVGQFRKFVEKKNYKTEAERDGKGGYGWNEAKGTFEQDPKYTWQSPGFKQEDDHPVVNVSWNDAVAFCEWLSQEEGQSYRLPTEAEWEYACRAGRTTRFSSGDDPESLATVGNVADGTAKEKYPDWTYAIKAKDGFVFTAPAGRFLPNGFDLYDMHGNVYEWCSDWYDSKYYSVSPSADPPGPSQAADRVIRGGSWVGYPLSCRSADRCRGAPDLRSLILGFRFARVRSGP